ncbi:MAG: hypothetical protein ACK53V_16820, partial [Planctomycetota bacterium]
HVCSKLLQLPPGIRRPRNLSQGHYLTPVTSLFLLKVICTNVPLSLAAFSLLYIVLGHGTVASYLMPFDINVTSALS